MKIKIFCEWDTDTREFSGWNVEGEGITLKHSGSSYYRIMKDGEQFQLGTVGGHCPGTEREASFGCQHNHLSFCFDRRN
jgi:hypothetical protein